MDTLSLHEKKVLVFRSPLSAYSWSIFAREPIDVSSKKTPLAKILLQAEGIESIQDGGTYTALIKVGIIFDEEQVIEKLRQTLTEAGYEILTDEALGFYRTSLKRIQGFDAADYSTDPVGN